MSSIDLAPSAYQLPLRRYRLIGVALVGAFVAAFAVWTMSAPLASAVIAVGRLEVAGSIKKVQHELGGTVAAILVAEGARVREGDVVLRLDPTTAQASLDIVSGKLDELWMSSARLRAERDGLAAVDLPAFFAGRAGEAGVAALFRTEQRLFSVRLAARIGQKNQLASRIDQLDSQIAGLKLQQAAKATEMRLTDTELSGARALFAKGVVPQSRVNDLERDAARLEGEAGQIAAEIAELGGKIAETRLQDLNIDQAAVADAGRELNEVESSISELSQRRLAAAEQLKKIDIRSPSTGYVHQLAVHTVGGVVGAGDVLMTIVPSDGLLDIEARVSPADIEALHEGEAATVRLPGLNHATTPDLDATVKVVGADLNEDPLTRQAYYPVTLELVAGQEARLNGVALVPGMPVEAFISGPRRTFLDYLMQPIRDRLPYALREQ